jgi:hypothetical protein
MLALRIAQIPPDALRKLQLNIKAPSGIISSGRHERNSIERADERAREITRPMILGAFRQTFPCQRACAARKLPPSPSDRLASL